MLLHRSQPIRDNLSAVKERSFPDTAVAGSAAKQDVEIIGGHLNPLGVFGPTDDLICDLDVVPQAFAVEALFDGGGPPAIPRLVVPIPVDAVEAMMLGRTLSHIGQESFEGIPPSVADADATTAVVRILGGSRVVAALFDSNPNAVSVRSVERSTRGTMGDDSTSQAFSVQAATTEGALSPEPIGANCSFRSAGAPTKVGDRTRNATARFNGPTPKGHAAKVELDGTRLSTHFGIVHQRAHYVKLEECPCRVT